MWCGQTQRRCTCTRLPVSIVNLYFFIKAALFVSIRSALNVVSIKFNKNKLLYVRKLAQENKERIIFLALKIVMFSFFALFPLKLSYLPQNEFRLIFWSFGHLPLGLQFNYTQMY